jgi:hypothetical protein
MNNLIIVSGFAAACLSFLVGYRIADRIRARRLLEGFTARECFELLHSRAHCVDRKSMASVLRRTAVTPQAMNPNG